MIRNKDGVLVRAGNGDFRFEARNIGLTAGGFDVNADVLVGKVEGEFFAAIETELNFALDGIASVAIEFDGSFDSSGNFALTGSGSMVIGEVAGVELTFSIVREGTSASVSAASRIEIPQLGSVDVSGSFSHNSKHGWFYEVTGQITVETTDYEFGQASFAAYRELERYGRYAVTGMRAELDVDIPDLARGGAFVSIDSLGYFSIGGYIATQGKLKSAIGDVDVRVDFKHTQNSTDFSFRVSVSDVMKVPGSFTISGAISSDESFFVSVDVQAGPWSKSASFAGCSASASASGTFTVEISRSSQGVFDIKIALDGNASARACGVGVSAGLTIDFEYNSNSPTEFSLTVKARLNFGSPIGAWEPRLYPPKI